MKDPLISIKLHSRSRVFAGGATLAGEFQIDAVQPEEIQAVEVSVLWHTEGKGDEDLAVHYFQRYAQESSGPTLHELRQFSTKLPLSPLSYQGTLFRLVWCVRLRVFGVHGKEVVAELPFQLGNLPIPRPAPAAKKPVFGKDAAKDRPFKRAEPAHEEHSRSDVKPGLGGE